MNMKTNKKTLKARDFEGFKNGQWGQIWAIGLGFTPEYPGSIPGASTKCQTYYKM